MIPNALVSLDLVSVWKVLSTALTGAFGILGLLTKYKTDDGRITGWGKISLAGILLSAAMGILVQLKEMSDAELSRSATAKQTPEVVKNLERLLQPLDAPSISTQFKVPCDKAAYANFCEAISNASDENYSAAWAKWPSAKRPDEPHEATALVTVSVFAKEVRRNVTPLPRPDWSFVYRVSPSTLDGSPKNAMVAFLSPDGGAISIDIKMDAPTEIDSAGTLQSLLDLDGATIVFSISAVPVPNERKSVSVVGIKPDQLSLVFRNGRRVDLTADELATERGVRQEIDTWFSTRMKLGSK